MQKIQPLADRVLVKPAAAEEKTVAGIIIPDSAKEKPLRGEIIAAGKGTKDEEMVLKTGDEVLYGKYAGTELELDGEKSERCAGHCRVIDDWTSDNWTID